MMGFVTAVALPIALCLLCRARPRDALSERIVIATAEPEANRAWARLGAAWLPVAPAAVSPVYLDAIDARRALRALPPLTDAQTRALEAWRAVCDAAWAERRHVLWLPAATPCPWDAPRRLRALLDTACRWPDWDYLRAAPDVWLFAPGALGAVRRDVLRTEHAPDALCVAALRAHPCGV
jgi:hypothetical protein